MYHIPKYIFVIVEHLLGVVSDCLLLTSCTDVNLDVLRCSFSFIVCRKEYFGVIFLKGLISPFRKKMTFPGGKNSLWILTQVI